MIRQQFKDHLLVILGFVVILVALALSSVQSSDVPNDPNIGAGLLFIVGIALLIVGGIVEWDRRKGHGL